MAARKRSAKPRRARSKPDLRAALERAEKRSTRAHPARAVASFVGLVVAILAAGLAGYLFVVFPSSTAPGHGGAIEFTAAPSESVDEFASRLAERGLIRFPWVFAWYMRLTGGTSHVVPGTHILTDDLSVRELRARLERKASVGHVKITFPEGWTRFDMAKRLEEKRICLGKGFLEASAQSALLAELRIDGATAEGFLFPATYDFALDTDPVDVIRKMKFEFDKRWAQLEEKHASELLDLETSLKFTIKEIVTLASMIEKEAVAHDERPIIASVFLNRLRDPEFKPKKLQCDPTAAYGCLVGGSAIASCASFTGKITPTILHDAANRYSTYEYEGLPPGPIANPGVKSLEGAIAPATTRYFYFVAKGEGRHTFSEKYESHTAAIRAASSAHAASNTAANVQTANVTQPAAPK